MRRYRNYLAVLPILAASVFISHGLKYYIDDFSAVMIYMLAVVVCAFFLDFGPALLTSLFSAALFDFFNLPPYLSFSRSPVDYVLTIAIMLATAGAISLLARRLRRRVTEAKHREAHTAAMYALTSDIAAAETEAEILAVTRQHIASAQGGEVSFFPEPAGGNEEAPCVVRTDVLPDGREHLTARLRIGGGESLRLAATCDAGSGDGRHLQAMLEQASLALDRTALRHQINRVQLKEQEQSLRNHLLNAISHDLRTPLASIIGAASSLLEQGDRFSDENRRQMRQIILDEALHMQGMVENLLDMARLQDQSFSEKGDWQALEEIVAGAMTILRRRISRHTLRTDVPDNLPLIRCDGFLLERVIVNLMENAARYSPPGTCIGLSARLQAGFVELLVCDEGPGIPEEQREQVFEPFHRLDSEAGNTAGLGLGLTICRNIVRAYGGDIRIESAPGGGTCMRVQLPVPPGTDNPDEPPLTPET